MTQSPRFTSPSITSKIVALLNHLSLVLLVCSLTSVVTATTAHAQSPRSEYRAYWVDTFNTTLNNHNDIVAVVNNAKASKANAIFAQVRRRGDAWYLNSLEPLPDGVPIAAGFDPLQDLITEAHASDIEVHAFVIVGAIWNRHPTISPLPLSPDHVFNRHGGYDPVTRTIVPGPNNWLTRTLLPDSTASAISFQGHRFGAEFWIDLGHPDAAADTADVLLHLVRNYDVDGLHLDRIRYPEFTATGQTPANGINIGYNETSVARFQQRYGIAAASAPPATNDPLWAQWRRDQVTNFVRRVYLNSIAVKPQIKISAALIAFGGGPTTEAAWISAEAYWRVYQDWRAWTEEGILDIAIPMNYKREHTPLQATQYDQWNEWTKNHQYNRAAIIGQGAFLNAIEGTLRQTRRALEPSSTGNSASGVIFFSMATTNVAVTANPFSQPPGQNTPARPFAEFASGLTTGKSVNGTILYEPTGLTPIFGEPATIPVFSWKAAPTLGHVMGFAWRADNSPLDTAIVTIENLSTGDTRTTATDGGGFYGGVDLAPGEYLARAELGSDVVYSCAFTVTAGNVTVADMLPETTAPVTTATLDPATPNGANGWYTSDVTITLDASDNCAGVAAVEYSTDNGATWQPNAGSFVVSTEGTTTILYRSTDRAGNTEAAQSLTIKIDKTAPTIQISANPSVIWPPNGKTVVVTITGSASDMVSGLAGVSYVVTDEYGTPLSIPSRTLSGNTATWTDTLGVEARRDGRDKDGRLYRVTAIVTDVAGNTASASTDIVVLHDQGKSK
ncbi:MAG: family 10 glycosylhydrolase [Acidobacteriota bacterium]|nr:family 10 glycosylhydrolase [Acidobacteriota bacterium]